MFATVSGPAAWASSDNAGAVSLSGLPDAPSAMTANDSKKVNADSTVSLELQDHPRVTVLKIPADMVQDGIHIAISPAYLRWNDLKWLVPLAGASAAAFATDTRTMTQVVSTNPSFNQTNLDVSNGLVGGMIAAPVALFAFGAQHKNDQARETGLLGSEAMADAYIVDQVVKLCTFRERPQVDNGRGRFYAGGADSSFVSDHSMVAWASAAVIAGEYKSKWVRLAVYSAAAGVSVTRVLGQQHFPSDVLLGSAGGWLIGHYVFRAHHSTHAERKMQ
jgi:membrane-associated phospholipid phosphatase